MKFILQQRTHEFDFQWALRDMVEYYNWFNDGQTDNDLKTEYIVATAPELMRIIPDFDPKEWCPVGSVEFVRGYLNKHFGLDPKPRNVPRCLWKFCRRKLANLYDGDSIESLPETIFRKDSDVIKSQWSPGPVKNDWLSFTDSDHHFHSHFQVSEIIPEIVSEWRCFVTQGDIKDIRNYSGDPWVMPDKQYLENCVDAITTDSTVGKIPAYTIDVAVCKAPDGSLYHEVIEVHDFFSCGLYGFNSPVVPVMMWRWFRWYTGGCKK